MTTHKDTAFHQCRTPSKLILIKSLAITTTLGLLVAVPAAIGVDEAIERGRKHYLAMFDDEWFQANAKNFLYAFDIRDVGTMFFFGLNLTFTTLSIAFRITLFELRVGYKDSVHSITVHSNANVSNNQHVDIVFTAIIFRLDIEILGNGIIAPWSSLGLLNAVTTLIVLSRS
ncbi:hypothetical protein M3Y98_00906200 [Aphelenchoides besseyi]|nr:hypothetical protein M3Y98_00906200 [Aphelenchoides besseyi]